MHSFQAGDPDSVIRAEEIEKLYREEMERVEREKGALQAKVELLRKAHWIGRIPRPRPWFLFKRRCPLCHIPLRHPQRVHVPNLSFFDLYTCACGYEGVVDKGLGSYD